MFIWQCLGGDGPLAIDLFMFCFWGCIDKVIFHFLVWFFFKERLQDLFPTQLQIIFIALLLSSDDLGTDWIQSLANFNSSDRIEDMKALSVLLSIISAIIIVPLQLGYRRDTSLCHKLMWLVCCSRTWFFMKSHPFLFFEYFLNFWILYYNSVESEMSPFKSRLRLIFPILLQLYSPS